MKKFRNIIVIMIICLVAAIEVAVLLSSALLAYQFSALFISTITLAIVLPLPKALRWSIIQAGLVDLYSVGPFGTYMFISILLVALVKFLQHNWFKQPSALSLSLISVVGLIVAQILLISVYQAADALNWLPFNPITELSLPVIVVGILVECFLISGIIKLFRLLPKFVLA